MKIQNIWQKGENSSQKESEWKKKGGSGERYANRGSYDTFIGKSLFSKIAISSLVGIGADKDFPKTLQCKWKALNNQLLKKDEKSVLLEESGGRGQSKCRNVKEEEKKTRREAEGWGNRIKNETRIKIRVKMLWSWKCRPKSHILAARSTRFHSARKIARCTLVAERALAPRLCNADCQNATIQTLFSIPSDWVG